MSSPNRGLRGLFTEALNEWLRFQSEVLDPEGHIRHYLGNAEVNDYSSVLNYKFPLNATVDEVTRALGWLEQADEEKAKREGKDARVLTKNNRQALITFKDGWQWQIVPEGACPDEGKAMRHCGNVPSVKKGDTLLSLREPIKKKGKKGWKPHATFILDRHGELGEMKGFANEKPAANTHKYIVELLKNDKVKGIGATN